MAKSQKEIINEHKVVNGKNGYIIRTAEYDQDARDVEKHFLDLGCDGGPGGGDETSKIVYAYKKAANTDP